MAHFKALLQELHLGPGARWRDYADRIRRDPQGRGDSSALERGEAEQLFRDHVQVGAWGWRGRFGKARPCGAVDAGRPAPA